MSSSRYRVDAATLVDSLERHGQSPTELILDRAWPVGEDGLSAFYRRRDRKDLDGAWTLIRPSERRSTVRLQRCVGAGEALWLPELETFALAFPFDPQISCAGLALNDAKASERLAPWLLGPAERCLDVEARPLRYKPLRRLVVEYRRVGGGADGVVYGKCVRRKSLGSIAENCRALEHDGDENGELEVPQVCGRVEEWNMLLWRGVNGTPLPEVLKGPGALEGVRRAARAAALVHRSPARPYVVHGRSAELRSLAAWVEITARAHPPDGSRLRSSFAEIARTRGAAQQTRLLPSHRDFHDGQLLIPRAGAVLLDLDTLAWAEPELDVANFVAHLELQGLEDGRFPSARLGEAFLGAYEDAVPRFTDARRFRWYLAAAVLRLACVHRFRPGGRKRSRRLQEVLMERLGLVVARVGAGT